MKDVKNLVSLIDLLKTTASHAWAHLIRELKFRFFKTKITNVTTKKICEFGILSINAKIACLANDL
jgi:hypothetical protein